MPRSFNISAVLMSNRLHNKFPAEEMLGVKFGRLTVLGPGERNPGIKCLQIWWKCKCECGSILSAAGSSLRRGDTKSCGCLTSDAFSLKYRKSPGAAGLNSLYYRYKGNAEHRGLSFALEKIDFKAITQSNCTYCGEPPSSVHRVGSKDKYPESHENSTYQYNGIDRVDNSVGYVLANCAPCCKTCNYAKLQMSVEEFLMWIEKVYNFNKGKFI